MSTTSTSIGWTDRTWSPVTGCDKVSPGCAHCYAEAIANRWTGKDGTPSKAFPNGFKLTLRPERLQEPLSWKKPAMVFVNSMSDLFHDGIPDDYLDEVFGTMALADQHTFQILTKRASNMQRWVTGPHAGVPGTWIAGEGAWPPRNVWLGVSVENYRFFDRIQHLRETPAAIRFISFEPWLGPLGPRPIVDLDLRGIDWIILGGESGPGARPCDLDQLRILIDAGRAAGCAIFVKQLGTCYMQTLRKAGAVVGKDYKGEDMAFWPEELRIREFPVVAP